MNASVSEHCRYIPIGWCWLEIFEAEKEEEEEGLGGHLPHNISEDNESHHPPDASTVQRK